MGLKHKLCREAIGKEPSCGMRSDCDPDGDMQGWWGCSQTVGKSHWREKGDFSILD